MLKWEHVTSHLTHSANQNILEEIGNTRDILKRAKDEHGEMFVTCGMCASFRVDALLDGSNRRFQRHIKGHGEASGQWWVCVHCFTMFSSYKLCDEHSLGCTNIA
jgi:hypothetical protein